MYAARQVGLRANGGAASALSERYAPQVRPAGGSGRITSKTYQTYVTEADEPHFGLRVLVIGGSGASAIQQKKVTVFIDGCSEQLC